MDKYEYEDGTLPKNVAHHLKQVAEEKAMKLLERKERPHMDDDEMREVEPGQTFNYSFLR